MDSFEPIRRTAAALHEKFVLAGVDPFRPLDLVNAALKDQDIELIWLEKGHAALKGARALYDDQSGTVICEQMADAGEAAQLVAHELGHVHVHASKASCSENDIDVSRSTESAPVGLQRVEDYGAHERRELQANVFAREFLLPRRTARRLHLEEKQGASAVITQTGLNKNLVRQQMFDALLMPVPPETEETRSIRPLRDDPSQRTAALHRGSAFQLQAGPGTGKTRTLETRVRSLLDEGVDPASILILTFSNRAAGELAERLGASAGDAAPRIWIGTFHAFGLDIVRRYHNRLGLPADPTLFDRSDAIEVLEEILPTLPLVHYRNLWDPAMVLRDIVAVISRAKDEMTDHVRYRALAEQMAVPDEASEIVREKALEVARVYEAYESAIRERGAVDFGDLIMRPTLLLESDSDIRAVIRLRHRHVLVDEYQDVNRASGRFLRAIAGDGKQLWVVGDARQSIYRFRGASSNNMKAFANEYPGAKADQLGINYRSTDDIVKSLVEMAPRMGASDGMLPLVFQSERGAGAHSVEIRHFETAEDEAGGIAATIRDLEQGGVRLRDQAVLCRTNKRLNEIATALEERGIPVLHLGSLFEREEIRDLLALLTLAVDRFGDGLARIGAMPRYGLSLQDVQLATSYLRTKDGRALMSLPELVSVAGISAEGTQALARLAADLDGLSASAFAWDYLAQYLLDRSDFVRELASKPAITDQMRGVAVWQFLNFVRERSPATSGHPIQRTLDRVRQLVLLAEERDLRQVPAGALHLNAVRLMTVHGSKGLEFEAVHVPTLTVPSFPASYRPPRCPAPTGMIEGAEGLTAEEEARASQAHEEQCLFFVACSRARSFLRLSSNRKPSSFFQWMLPSLSSVISNPTMMEGPEVRLELKPIPAKTLADLTESKLTAYNKCPLRFFYTHVLGLGNARKPTAFTRTHDCIYDFMRWLSESRSAAEPTMAEAEAQFDVIWKEKGPADHAFAGDYRSLASRLIGTLLQSGAGRTFRNAEPLAIDFSTGRVWVQPNERADLPDGTVILRRIHTGKKRKDEYDRLEYTLYHLAGESNFGSAFTVEAVHLTDGIVEPAETTARKLAHRKKTSESIVQKIAAGEFPTDPDPVTCPRCPHFFICASVPAGNLTSVE